MTYDVLLHRRAQEELDDLPEEAFRKLDPAIRDLAANPRPVGVKKLEDDLYRVRLGAWRVIYAIHDRERRVIVLRVARRSERTYKRLPR